MNKVVKKQKKIVKQLIKKKKTSKLVSSTTTKPKTNAECSVNSKLCRKIRHSGRRRGKSRCNNDRVRELERLATILPIIRGLLTRPIQFRYPRCLENDFYHPKQCIMQINPASINPAVQETSCWCVEADGTEIPKTRHNDKDVPKHLHPNCKRHQELALNACKDKAGNTTIGCTRHPFDCKRYMHSSLTECYSCTCPGNKYFDCIKKTCVKGSDVECDECDKEVRS